MSLELIKKIRTATGAGMQDVKTALDEAGGDEEKAIEILRKAGAKTAAKKADRETSEGVIAFAQADGKLAVVSVACETDFVARNEDFIAAVQKLADQLLAEGQDGFVDKTTKFIQDELVVKIGENLHLVHSEILEGKAIGKYLHSNNKVASAVVLSEGSEEIGNEIAMHAAAMAPRYLTPEEVPAEELDKEREIYREQLKSEGKPEDVMQKILEGKVNKYFTEVCLLKQPFVKDDKKSIEQYLKENNAAIEKFSYYAL